MAKILGSLKIGKIISNEDCDETNIVVSKNFSKKMYNNKTKIKKMRYDK